MHISSPKFISPRRLSFLILDRKEQLLYSIKNHEIDNITQIIEENPEFLLEHFESDDSQKKTLLHFAVEAKNVEAVRYFIHKGVPIDSLDSEKNTPLNTYCECLNEEDEPAYFEIIKILISLGAHYDIPNEWHKDFFLSLEVDHPRILTKTIDFLMNSEQNPKGPFKTPLEFLALAETLIQIDHLDYFKLIFQLFPKIFPDGHKETIQNLIMYSRSYHSGICHYIYQDCLLQVLISRKKTEWVDFLLTFSPQLNSNNQCYLLQILIEDLDFLMATDYATSTFLKLIHHGANPETLLIGKSHKNITIKNYIFHKAKEIIFKSGSDPINKTYKNIAEKLIPSEIEAESFLLNACEYN
jgi:hypothetical protein